MTMSDVIRFFVPGKPAPRGSKRAFTNPKTGRPIITDMSKRSGPWMDTVKAAAIVAMSGREMFPRHVPLQVDFFFQLKRPKGHFGTGRNADKLKPSALRRPSKQPDLLKLARPVEDALSNVVYYDDAASVDIHLHKNYGYPLGVLIEVRQEGPATVGEVRDDVEA